MYTSKQWVCFVLGHMGYLGFPGGFNKSNQSIKTVTASSLGKGKGTSPR
jgi:hypothetical protein